MLDTYRVSLKTLDAMAECNSDIAIVQQLKRVNRSRHLTLLRAVLDRAQVRASDVAPSLEEAWTLLAAAQQRDEAEVDRVVGHPRTGLWAAKVLRRMEKTTAADDDPPLWAELGYLHQMATAAAIRAGHDFRSRVPVWRGMVMLPTLGLADVRSNREWDFAQVHSEDGQVLIRGTSGSVQLPEDRSADGAGWMALRTLCGNGYELWFDDLDPYREFDGPIPPHRLASREVDLWADRLRETWELLTKHHPTTAAELATGLTTLVPHPQADGFTPFSASHHEVFGTVVLSRPPDVTTFAEILVHEFQHSKFGVLLTLLDLLDPDGDNDTPRLYAPWRDDPRPATGVLHGAFSFLGVAAFYRKQCSVEIGPPARAVQFEFAYRRKQTKYAIETLLENANLSVLGRRFLNIARATLQAWGAEPVPEDVRMAAERVTMDHQLSWRLRHLKPSAALAAELAQAWLQHRARPAVSADVLLKPTPGSASGARLALARVWLTEPELFDVYRTEPELAMVEIDGTTAADLALTGGDLHTATELYLQQIGVSPDSVAAWAGLALASQEELLQHRPELVFAVHREIRVRSGVSTNPLRLAQWLR